jgi:hypothetical protein
MKDTGDVSTKYIVKGLRKTERVIARDHGIHRTSDHR